MSTYKQQLVNTEKYNDQAITAVEAEGSDILYSFLPEDLLHRIINNPVDQGVDEA